MNAEEPPPPGWFWRGLARSPLLWLGLRTWSRGLLRVHVEGAENLRPGSPAVYAGNHGSHYDLFILLAVLSGTPRIRVVPASWHKLLTMPVVGPLLRAHGAVPVNHAPEAAAERTVTLRRLLGHLRAGRSVAIWPEGRRNDRLGSFEPGAALLAWQAGVPLVPFTLRGVQPLFKKVGWPDRLTGKVTVVFHAALDPRAIAATVAAQGGDFAAQLAAVTAELRNGVAGALDYPDRPAA